MVPKLYISLLFSCPEFEMLLMLLSDLRLLPDGDVFLSCLVEWCSVEITPPEESICQIVD